MEQTDWIDVEYPSYENSHTEVERGVTIRWSASPYDVPIKVRSRIEQARNLLVIDLEYLGRERTTHRVSLGNHVHAEVGKKSDRVYTIELDIDAIGADFVRLEAQVERARSALDSAITPARPLRNYDLVRRVVGDHWARLVGTMHPTKVARAAG